MLRIRPVASLWALALAVLAACSQPMTGGEPVAEPVPAPEVKATDVDEDSEVKVDFGVLEGAFSMPDLCRYGVGDPLLSDEPCPPKAKDEHEGLSAFEAARRELKADQGRKTGTARSPESERANAHPWGSLPPARISQSSDGCIGYCFDAVLGAVDQTDSRVARVVIFDQKGRPTRALVHRRRPYGPFPDTSPVRFTCFDQSYEDGVPVFEGCGQEPTAAPSQASRPRRTNSRTRERMESEIHDLGGTDLIDPL